MSCEKLTASTVGIPISQCTYKESACIVKKANHKNESPNEPNKRPERAGAELATMTNEKPHLKNSQPKLDEAAEYVKKHSKFQNCYPLVSAEATQSEPCNMHTQSLDGILEPARLSAYTLYHNYLTNQPGRAAITFHDFMSSNTSTTIDQVISGDMTTPEL